MAGSRPHGRDTRRSDVEQRIRNEFVEMPGMQLTFEQIRRLWHLSHDECEVVLERLLGERLLTRDGQRRFRLSSHRSELAPPRPAAWRGERSA
jgi:Fic family protein